MLDFSNQKILFNKNYSNNRFFRENDLPVPIFFAIPTLAFHVSINTIKEKRNFIQETILYLKRNGVPKDEISDKLCLDQNLVDIIINNNKKDSSNGEVSIIEKEEKSVDFYIFYDLITNQFIDEFMYTDRFNESCAPINPTEFNSQNQCFYLRQCLGDSNYTKVHMLPKNFDKKISPTQKDIISCYKSEQLFDDRSYREARFLNEMYHVWLVLGYSVTNFDNKRYAIINPFDEDVTFSTYFTNIINTIATDSYSYEDIQEYKNNTENWIIKRQNEKINITNDKERIAYESLAKKYRKYGYFKDKQNGTKFEMQMVKMQATYDYISKNCGKSDCSSQIRNFYDFANNVLEQLLIFITYKPFIFELPKQMQQDQLFDILGREKTYAGEKDVLRTYFESVESNYDLTGILKKCNIEQTIKTIKNKNINNPTSFKLGVNDLMAINVLCAYYNRESKFNRLLKSNIKNLMDTITVLTDYRRIERHTFDKPENVVKDVCEVIYKIIDVVSDVNENDTERIEINNDDSEEYTNFLGEYPDLENMSELLRASCNQLLMDIFNSDILYYSDCVIAFENTSQVILDYIMNKINTPGDLGNLLESIPEDDDEAKILLMEKLETINIHIDFDHVSLNIKKAKKCMLNNYPFKQASTMILFAPLLLAVFDYTSFITLFEQLGQDYFEDAICSIQNRGHDSQATDWGRIRLINDKYVNYCRILTLFEREEL